MTTLMMETDGKREFFSAGDRWEQRLGPVRLRFWFDGCALQLRADDEVRCGRLWLRDAQLPERGQLAAGGCQLRWAPCDDESLPGLVGRSTAMRGLAKVVRRLAPASWPVLIRGASGTGKELVAHSLHALSPRRDGPFVAVNGATLSASLGGSQLFGHVRGAFTGAHVEREGAMRRAHGGSLFIDEVSTLCVEVQAALLRVLEQKVVVPVGSDEEHEVDVRLITATCEPLEAAVAMGRFRIDLYQRLATTVVRVPSLDHRRGDIPALAQHLLQVIGLPEVSLDEDAIELLGELSYPGNVRELRNLLVQAACCSDGPCILRDDVERALHMQRASGAAKVIGVDPVRVLSEYGGNRSAAARALGVPRSTFRDWLRRATRGGSHHGAPADRAAQNRPLTPTPCT